MRIKDLIDGLPVRLRTGSPDTTVTDVVEDSRQATRGCLFIARPGTKSDGRRYIEAAKAAGAVAVLSTDSEEVPEAMTSLTAEDVPLMAAHMAERFHGRPTEHLELIGITGTNGKTTTAYLIRHLLKTAGRKCGLIGTVQIDDGAEVAPAELTTPPSVELSRLMRSMVDHGCKACVMETSSHALHQKRTAGLKFDVGVFTNLTGDHLDYHRTMDEYARAKGLLFESLPSGGAAVINMDSDGAELMVAASACRVIRCSLMDSSAECRAEIGRQTLSHLEVRFFGPWGQFDCRLPLIGRHNAMNAMQALAACWSLGVGTDELQQGIAECQAPPGRLEPVTTPEDGFAVLVDYAHTDDALENVLRSLRPIVPQGGRLRVVFGCGGDRDRTKRPRMARMACRYADDVIITSDNPRTEDPQVIINEIRAGVPVERLAATPCVADRAEAIRTAIDRTRDGDIVLIAGKGHEDYQIIGTTKRPFDDRLAAAEALARRGAGVGAG